MYVWYIFYIYLISFEDDWGWLGPSCSLDPALPIISLASICLVLAFWTPPKPIPKLSNEYKYINILYRYIIYILYMFQIYFWSVPGGFTVKCPLFTASPKPFLRFERPPRTLGDYFFSFYCFRISNSISFNYNSLVYGV